MNITQTAGPLRALAIAVASLAMMTGVQAQSHHGGGRGGTHFSHGGAPGGAWRGGHGGPRYGHRGSGVFWGGVGLGLGWGLASYYYPWYAAGPDYVVVDAPVVYGGSQPVPASATGSQQPVIYPRNGQSAAKTDADSDECSRWAGSQPNATADASVFRRGIAACMDARGYTVR